MAWWQIIGLASCAVVTIGVMAASVFYAVTRPWTD